MSDLFVRAIVTDIDDPDKLGRVRVKYPYLGDAANTPSPWAKVLRPVSHDGSGDWFLPDVGDEVLVSYERGSKENPVVLGAVYSAQKKVPDLANFDAKKNNLRAIKTKVGHLLLFDDDQAITLQHKDGHTLILKNESVELKNKSGTSIQLKDGKLTIDAADSIELGAGASEALVKGKTFLQLFNAHTHTGNLGAPTSPPTQPLQPAQVLSQKVKTT